MKLRSLQEKLCEFSAALTGDLRDSLVDFLVHHKIAFAWSHVDMEGIDPAIIAHQLSILPGTKLI